MVQDRNEECGGHGGKLVGIGVDREEAQSHGSESTGTAESGREVRRGLQEDVLGM